MKINLSDKSILGICLFILAVYLSPYFVFPNNALFLVHDNLNSNVIWYSSIATEKYFFAPNNTIVPFMFNGIPRACYPSELNLYLLFYYFFSPLFAYCLNSILIHLVAFFGTIFFLKNYLLKGVNNSLIYLVALCYACLPFWPSGQIGVAGMPLLLCALLNILNNSNLKLSWFVVVVFPFYSSIVFSNLFFLIAFGAIYIVLVVFKKTTFSWKLIIALALFSAISLLTEYRLIYMQFVEKLVTHRSLNGEGYSGSLNFFGWIGSALKHFFLSQYHFYTMHVLILVCATPVFFMAEKKQRYKIVGIIVLMLTISLTFLSSHVIFLNKISKYFSLNNSMQFRFIALYPLLTLMLFAILVKTLWSKNYYKTTYVFILAQLVYVLFMFIPGDYNNNVYAESAFYNTHIKNKSYASTFSNYYRFEMFAEVKKVVPPGEYNVLILGFEPQVVNMSNYNTIDGYHYFYPLEKTEMLKKIIQPYSDKYPQRKIHLGSRTSINGLLKSSVYDDSLKMIYLNFDILKQNNCRYIFSLREVSDPHIIPIKNLFTARGALFTYQIKN